MVRTSQLRGEQELPQVFAILGIHGMDYSSLVDETRRKRDA
jgi:hypothetical protein